MIRTLDERIDRAKKRCYLTGKAYRDAWKKYLVTPEGDWKTMDRKREEFFRAIATVERLQTPKPRLVTRKLRKR